jgi:hypothetical protein
VDPAERDVDASAAVVVGDLVGAVGATDVDLDADQVGLVVEVERLDVLVLKGDLVIISQIACERRQSERRPEGVLDATA